MRRNFLAKLADWDPLEPLSVLGPTGSGKTAAVLAEIRARYPRNLKHPLIISVDSVAVYRGLDIGAAKPRGAERDPYDWRGLDLATPADTYTAADFVGQLLPLAELARAQGRPLIFVGGSHFYERALVEGMSPGAASDPGFVARLASVDSNELHARLVARDARWGTRLHPNDRYRLLRALDLTERQGLSFDDLLVPRSARHRPWSTVATFLLGADRPAELIRDAMLLRIRAMLAQGWIPETQSLMGTYSAQAPSLRSVGYRQIAQMLEGEFPRQDLESRILTAHMQLAKKQRTWLRGLRAKAVSPK